MPAVSVVIPTHARETRLAFALEALGEQTLPSDLFEVVVVRASGAPGPWAPIPDGLDVRYLTVGSGSAAGKRNAGWRAARGGLVAFTDDDCRADPAWLETLLDRARGAATFLQGRTVPDSDETHLLFGLARSVRIEEANPWFETCNIAYPRELLERLGGFDEELVQSGEDTDLGLRALAAGAERHYLESAVVRHAVVAQPLGAAIRRGWGRWETFPLVFKRHPAHRRHLFARLFFNRTHAAVLGALAGAVLARRRPLLAAAVTAPFAIDSIDRENLRPRGLARQLLHMPARFAREASVVAGVTRGAVRHRTPVI